MFRLFARVSLVGCLLAVTLLAGCSGKSAGPVSQEISGPGGQSPPTGSPPSATILDPAPSALLRPRVTLPITIKWTGEAPDGPLREFRYRLFGRTNPDIPHIVDFVEFLDVNPDSVLRFYEKGFAGWETQEVEKDSGPFSVEYSNLVPYEHYAFVVVAIDKRGDHDAHLEMSRNVLNFEVKYVP